MIILLYYYPVFKAYQRTNQNRKHRKRTASFLDDLMSHITHKYITRHNTTQCQSTHSPRLQTTPSITLPSWLAAVNPQLYSSNHFLHIHQAFHCTVTVPKVTACCCFTPPLPRHSSLPLICNLSDLVRAEIARNPANLHRPQGSVSIGPQRAHRTLQACMKPHARTVMHDSI